MHAVILAVMDELNSNKIPYIGGFTDLWAVANGLPVWSGRGKWEPGMLKGRPYGA